MNEAIDTDQQLAALLIRQKTLEPADLERAQAEAVKRRIPLREALIGMAICLEDQINWAVSRDLNIPFVILTGEMIDRDLLAEFPSDFLRATRALPIPDALGGVTLVMGDALDEDNFERARQYCKCEMQRAVGPMGRIQALLNQLMPREAAERREAVKEAGVKERPAGRIDAGGVAAAYQMLVDARRRYACRILLRPAGDGLEAAFKLERGWILYRAWSHQEALAVITRCRIMAGLSAKPTADHEQARLVTRIKGERIRFGFDFLHLAEGETLNISVTPLYACVPFTQMESLHEAHRKALSSLFSARRPTGVILVNAPDERQRHRMVYGLISALVPQNYQILSMEREQYFECAPIHRVQLSGEPGDALLQSGHKTDIIAVPSAPPWCFREFFYYGGDQLVILGMDFVNSLLALRVILEEIKVRALLADRLRAVWCGRRVDMTCPECQGAVNLHRGQESKDVCPACNGYGRIRGADLFEVALPDPAFRLIVSQEKAQDLLESELARMIVPPDIKSQLQAGVQDGSIFAWAPDFSELE